MVLAPLLATLLLAAPPAELIDVTVIGGEAPHNAFTDLVRFRGRFYCAFREGQAHVSPDGALKVIASADGREWATVARLASPTADLRDAKLSVTPDGRLMLLGAGALRPPAAHRHQTFAWFSDPEGQRFGEAVPIGEPDFWLWRVTWHEGAAYGVGYATAGPQIARLYKSADGRAFAPIVPTLHAEGYPNESAIVFLPDGTALCLLRRDGTPSSGLLGRARPPYTDWAWTDLGVKIGGPSLVRLADGRLIAGVRLYDGKVRTAICELDPEAGRLTELLALPSGGDTSYPGLVWHEGLLWVSYYSSHEGRAKIYFARVRLEPGAR
jgi:hypothetical protein